jgi:hypothetical protein
MQTQHKQVRIDVDQTNLLAALRQAFSGSTTFVGELMQNARRAGATRVTFAVNPGESDRGVTLVVEDDGRGIESVDALLCVARSNWDAETTARESPYGVGFLAALYAARRVRVESGGFSFETDTETLLAGEHVTVQLETERRGTRITLMGVEVGAVSDEEARERLGAEVGRQSKGFPIAVALNGGELARPHAIDETFAPHDACGHIRIPGVHTADGAGSSEAIERGLRYMPVVYLNGQPVLEMAGRSFRYSGDGVAVVVHLDPTRFRARWPDREHLYDHGTAVEAIGAASADLVRAFLIDRKAAYCGGQVAEGRDGEIGEMDFVGEYLALFRFAPELFRTAARLHGVLLTSWEYPMIPLDSGREDGRECDWRRLAPNGFSREEVERGEVVLIDASEGFSPEEHALAPMAAYAADNAYGVVEPHKLPAWADRYLIRDKDLVVRVLDIAEPVERYPTATFYGWPWIVFCRGYRIETRDGRVLAEITADAMYLEYPKAIASGVLLGDTDLLPADGTGGVLLMPDGAWGTDVVRQVSDFTDDDEYQERRMEDEATRLALVIAARRNSPARTAEQLIRTMDASWCRVLAGKSFRVVFDDHGMAHVEESQGE